MQRCRLLAPPIPTRRTYRRSAAAACWPPAPGSIGDGGGAAASTTSHTQLLYLGHRGDQPTNSKIHPRHNFPDKHKIQVLEAAADVPECKRTMADDLDAFFGEVSTVEEEAKRDSKMKKFRKRSKAIKMEKRFRWPKKLGMNEGGIVRRRGPR